MDDYYLLVIINCGCIDESALASVCRTYVVLARALRPRLMGVPTCDPLGLATLATVASAILQLVLLVDLFSFLFLYVSMALSP